MDSMTILQIITGLIWTIVAILIVIWLVIPSDIFLWGLWWMFAIGCLLTGLWMLIEPLLRKKE